MNFAVLATQFWSLCLQGVALGFIYVLISLGYTMVYGVLRLINFANSEVVMVGTFATVPTSGIDTGQRNEKPFRLAMAGEKTATGASAGQQRRHQTCG